MTERPAPGTHELDLYRILLAGMSRAGRQVDFDGCSRLAHVIQEQGRKSRAARKLARELGLDPKWLPRQRRSEEVHVATPKVGIFGLCLTCGLWQDESELPVGDPEGRCRTCIRRAEYDAALTQRALRDKHAVEDAREEFSHWDKE